jgi:hypothetical protein
VYILAIFELAQYVALGWHILTISPLNSVRTMRVRLHPDISMPNPGALLLLTLNGDTVVGWRYVIMGDGDGATTQIRQCYSA